jgi:hypothetical protein
MGVFIGLCARRPEWLRAGLVASLLAVATIGAARAVGLAVDGHPNAVMPLLLSTEIIFVALYAVALRRCSAS